MTKAGPRSVAPSRCPLRLPLSFNTAETTPLYDSGSAEV
jgi:hypothetical protein